MPGSGALMLILIVPVLCCLWPLACDLLMMSRTDEIDGNAGLIG